MLDGLCPRPRAVVGSIRLGDLSSEPSLVCQVRFRELLPGCHDHAPHSIAGAKLQHENDLPLARVTTAVGCQRAICPETTTASWGFLRDTGQVFGPPSTHLRAETFGMAVRAHG